MKRRLSAGFSFILLTSMLLSACEGVNSSGPESESARGVEVPIAEFAPTIVAMISETPQPAATASSTPEVQMDREITELKLENVKDKAVINEMMADYDRSDLFRYSDQTNLEVVVGKESGLTFMAGFKVTDPDNNMVGQLAWLRGKSSENALAVKLGGDIGWVIPYRLGLVKVDGSDQLVEMYGYSTSTDTVLVYGINVDASGKPMKGGVFCYFDEDLPEGVCNPLSTGEDSGKFGLAELAPDLSADLDKTEELLGELGADTSDWLIQYNEKWGEEAELGYWLANDVFIAVDDQTVEMKLADGTVVKLSEGTYSFNKDGSLIINGFGKDEDGKWVETSSEFEKQAIADLRLFNKTIADFDVFITEDGSYTLIDPKSLETVYVNGDWQLVNVRKLIRKSANCKETNSEGTRIGPSNSPQEIRDTIVEPLIEYYKLLRQNGTVPVLGTSYKVEYMGDKCWGIMPYTPNKEMSKSLLFWKDGKGRPEYVNVFFSDPNE